jgi:hypothetical protein
MASKFFAQGDQTLTTSYATAITLGPNATTANRNYINLITIGHLGTPGDNIIEHILQRTTTLGTSTAVTPSRRDLADRLAQAVVGSNHTAEPTYTASTMLLRIPLATRGSIILQLAPGAELITPATANAAIGAKALHATSTLDWSFGLGWEE